MSRKPALLLAPWVGGAWLVAAPIIGLATVAWGLARRAAAAGARALGATMARGRAPGEAHRRQEVERQADP